MKQANNAVILLIVMLFVAGSLACVGNDKAEFGIYLADSGELVLSEEHIKAYYPDAHTIELNEEGIEKWNSYMTYPTIPRLDKCLFSRDFVLRIKGEDIYEGKFYSMVSSIGDPGIVIMDALFKLDSTYNTIWIKTCYPGSFSENQDDPRNDPRIINFFEKKGLLKEGEPPSQQIIQPMNHPPNAKPASGPISHPVTINGDGSQWDDFWGFSTGSNYEGYHLEDGSTICHLKGGVTKVYGPDNELVLCVNDTEVKQVPVPGGKGPQPATHVLNVPNGSVITHDGFVTRAAGLTVVDMATDSYDDKFVDREAFSGYWRATGGDVEIPESERESAKIYNYDGYGIKIENDDRAQITFNNEIDQTKAEGTVNEDEIQLSFGSFEAIFRFHDETTTYAAFYDDDRAYVKQLTRQTHVPIETILGPEVKPQPGEYLTCPDQESSGILLESVDVESIISDEQYTNSAVGLNQQVEPGDLIVVIDGVIENRGADGPYVAIWAEGHDAQGNVVCWTLDAAHVCGQSQVQVDRGKVNSFTLHLNFAETLRAIEIHACAYSEPPP